jgi:DNA-directed RNA polymerase specialized sigma24 family protein
MTDLCRKIEAEIPRLRRYARALTRDAVAADDLVQDCLARGLAKQHLWKAGTDLRAWLFTILHNQHVNQVRRAVREGTAVAINEASLTRPGDQDRTLELRDLDRGLARLPEEQRTVIHIRVATNTVHHGADARPSWDSGARWLDATMVNPRNPHPDADAAARSRPVGV